MDIIDILMAKMLSGGSGGGGGSVTVDSALSSTSRNPVQNKVVTEAIDGATPFEIPFTTTGLYDPWVFDSSKGVTSADIFDAVSAEKPIVARVETADWVELIPANVAHADKSTEYRSAYLEFWMFGDSVTNNSEYFFVSMTAEPDIGDPATEITVDNTHRMKKTLPAVTASDNGKFLRVVSGTWAAQAVPAAESSSFGGA